MKPLVFDFMDENAPVITANDPKTVIEVLRVCLAGVGDSGIAYNGRPSAGWEVPFEDTDNSKIVFRQPAGNRFYLRLGEPGSHSPGHNYYGTRYINVRGYESMTDIDTGLRAFPTGNQRAMDSSVFAWCWALCYSSQDNRTSPIPWTIIADDQFFYVRFQASQYGGNDTNPTMYWFGDIVSRMGNDAFNTIICGDHCSLDNSNSWESPTRNYTWPYYYRPFYGSYITETTLPHYIARPYTQIGNSTMVSFASDMVRSGRGFGDGGIAFPDPITNSVGMSPTYINENYNGAHIRGLFPGLWAPHQTRPFRDMEVVQGAGEAVGKEFISIRQKDSQRSLESSHDAWNILISLDDWRA